jgi:pyridoxine kinase
MRRVLVLSSFVARGTVGLQATLPGLPADAFDVVAMPTIVLSNHPGHRACAGAAIAPDVLSGMVDALLANGWLGQLDAVFSGYLPSAAHVTFAVHLFERLRDLNPSIVRVVDPVIGDDPGGLYVARETAEAIRDRLVPLADLTTPNRFELAWLSGSGVDDVPSAARAAKKLAPALVAATSIPHDNGKICNALIGSDTFVSESCVKLPNVPHGTGDYFAGLITAAKLQGHGDGEALRTASLGVARVIAASAGDDRLKFAAITATHRAHS